MRHRKLVIFITCISLIVATLSTYITAVDIQPTINGLHFDNEVPSEVISSLSEEQLEVLRNETNGTIIELYTEQYCEDENGNLTLASSTVQGRGLIPSSDLDLTISVSIEDSSDPLTLKTVAMATWNVYRPHHNTDIMGLTWNDKFALCSQSSNDCYAYAYYHEFYYNEEEATDGARGFDYNRSEGPVAGANYVWFGHNLEPKDKMLVTVAVVEEEAPYTRPVAFRPTLYYFHIYQSIAFSQMSFGIPPSISVPVDTTYDTATLYSPETYE